MNWLYWIVFGALAGWVAGLVTGTSRRRGCLFNIVVGIIGAFIGGLLMQLVTGQRFSFSDFGFNWPSFAVAVIGSVILLAIVGRGRR